MKKTLLAILIPLLSLSVWAQTESALNCTQTLRAARTLYDQGRLHELRGTLAKCLENREDEGGFTAVERIEAYKILTLSFIYLEEPSQADSSMIQLLRTDHFFTLNEEVDAVEFQNLYRKFRTEPVYRYGFKFGLNTNHINVLKHYYIWGAARGKGVYKPNFSIQATALFEKDLSERFTLNPEVSYSINSYTYQNATPLSNQNDPLKQDGELEHDFVRKKLQLNALVQYRLTKPDNVADKIIPFVAAGPSLEYLLESTFSGFTDVDETVSQTEINTNTHYKPLIISFTVMAGAKIRLGGFYLTGDIRFQYGFMNIVNKSNRWRWDGEDEALLDSGYVDNDYAISQSMINIGLIFPRFRPIKLIR